MSFKTGKSNVMGSPCSQCELLLDAIPWSVILSVHSVMLQSHLSCVMKSGTEAQRLRGAEAQRQG